jgi:hypothetical protein
MDCPEVGAVVEQVGDEAAARGTSRPRPHSGKLGYHDDEGDRAVVYFGEPIRSGYVLIKRDHLVNVTSRKHERWRRTAP